MFNDIFFFPIVIISIALLMVLITFLRAKTIQEKTVSFDVMTIATTSILVFLSFINGRAFYLDIAIVYSLLSFIGVIIVARYQEKGL